ncbi:MAG: response regulator transcription factor [Lachnospiraceae bacterium]|nr:response regulator transcription factor [Lachnospiraceae bacterium]MBQ2101285.1 response regulator transcription factor [Lachnospiraceae bacterium]
MHYQCLIVDDEIELAKMTAEYFEMFDIKTQYVDSAESCFAFLEKNDVDVILLDINLGDGSGFEVCKRIRTEYQLPILFISARQSDDDVLVALSIGGDDYVKKPYSLSVLLAKVKVNLKRVEQMKGLENAGQSADSAPKEERMTLDGATMSVIFEGKRISLKAKEFALLNALYQRKNTIVTKDQLFDEVWGDTFYSDGTLNVHVRKLREKLEEDPNNPKYIKTIWGTGYILEV